MLASVFAELTLKSVVNGDKTRIALQEQVVHSASSAVIARASTIWLTYKSS